MQIKIFISLFFILAIISGGNSSNAAKNSDSSNVVCDEKGRTYETADIAREQGLSGSEFGATYCNQVKTLHYTWDMNEDGINDCENDGSCDHTDDYSLPRYKILGVDSGIVFDKRSGKWVDDSGICHTCTPKNGYKNNGTMDESMFEANHEKNTIATITDSAKTPDGNFAYTITYNVTGGNAKNMEGKLIQGLLSQHIFGVKQQAIKGQKVEIRYRIEDPMSFELLEKISFVK